MDKYRCTICGYVYDSDRCMLCDYARNPKKDDLDTNIAPGTAFEDIPGDWVCPECGAKKDSFKKI